MNKKMATELNARQDRHQTIAFTLPISCQICLGKVKQPVLCPNNHVFCSQCMNVWLQRNKQCPACRVPINPGNPVRKILGGLNHSTEDDKDKMSNPELRKARFDLLFKDYEDEIERLNSEVQLLKTENDAMRQQLQKDSGSSKAGPKDKYGIQSAKTTETNGLLMLTKKLQDAQKLYEKVKTELAKHKGENNSLKDENVNLNRENQRLRVEIGNRSPHRYGRTTVATLESKVQSYEKEVGQLNKALEKSDKYIEELQKELQECKKKDKTVPVGTSHSDKYSTDYLAGYGSKKYTDNTTSEPYSSQNGYDSKSLTSSASLYGVGADHPSKRQLFNGDDLEVGKKDQFSTGRRDYVNGDLNVHADNSKNSDMFYSSGKRDYVKSSRYDADDDEEDDYYKLRNSTSKSKGGNSGAKNTKRVTFDIPKDRNETASFDLEMPSPMKSASLNRSLNGTTPSPVKGVLKNGKKSKYGSIDSLNLSKPSSLEDSFSTDHGYSKKYSKDDSDIIPSKSAGYSKEDDLITWSRSSRSDYYSGGGLNESFSLDQPDRKSSNRRRDNLDDTQTIESELDELNISVTPDFTDCMKLLNRAEKKVHDHVEPYVDSDPLYGNYKSTNFLDDFPSTKDTYSSNYKHVDPLSSDFTSSTRASAYSSKSENTYTSSYGSANTYKPAYSAPTNSEGGYSKSAYPSSSVDSLGDYKTNYTSTNTGLDIPGNQYSAPSASGNVPAYTSSASEGLNKKYPAATDIDKRYSLPAESTNYKSSYGNVSNYKSGLYSDKAPATNNVDSYSTKYTSSSKPLAQSGFGRSPSLDNLFMQKKPSHDTGSRYATAEDLPSPTSYKSRRSLPSYSSAKGRMSGSAAGSSDNKTGSNQDYMGSAALPPKPTRIRSYSDMGTSVASLPAHHRGKDYASSNTAASPSTAQPLSAPLDEPEYNMSYHRGTGKDYASSNTVASPSTVQPLSAPLDEPQYNMSYSSKYSSLPTTNNVAYVDDPVTNYPHSVAYSDEPVANYPSFVANGDDPVANYSRSAVSSHFGGGTDSLHSFSGGGSGAVTLNTNTDPLYSALPPRPKSGYSYSDIDLGVNPRNKSAFSSDSFSFRGRSASLDLPVSELKSSFENKALYSKYSSTDTNMYASNNPDTAYTLSLTGATNRPGSMDDGYTSTALPPRYSSSSSSTAYMPSSMTSVISSATFSLANPSTSYPSSSATATSSSYPMKPLDMIQETSGKYSYLSNNSSLGDISKSDSYLPEPKKRLFDSNDDLDLSLSPIKATRKM